MDLIFNTPIEEVIKGRHSVRTYTEDVIPEEIEKNIKAYISDLSNPFGAKVSFHLVESDAATNAKLGTYGVIKGARNYIGASVQEEAFGLEGLGYEFEKLILYITSLGLGTCWLAGTFKRSEFAKAMSIKEGDLFPAVSPFGFGDDKKSFSDSMVRFIAKSNTRKAWPELFFKQSFSTPLSNDDAGMYETPLEMLRIAPSASNKQPWRIVKDNELYHFYEQQSPGYSKPLGYDVQRIDMGIAACHFHLTAIEKGLKGEFKTLPAPLAEIPENTIYKFSWLAEGKCCI